MAKFIFSATGRANESIFKRISKRIAIWQTAFSFSEGSTGLLMYAKMGILTKMGWHFQHDANMPRLINLKD